MKEQKLEEYLDKLFMSPEEIIKRKRWLKEMEKIEEE